MNDNWPNATDIFGAFRPKNLFKGSSQMTKYVPMPADD
jgi:hypothetical protein